MNFDELANQVMQRGMAGSNNPSVDQMFVGQYAADPTIGARAGAQRQQDDIARANAERAAAAAAKAEADKRDPSKARMQRREDGGYDFFDGSGEQISVFDFSILTGQRPDDILSKSDNPRDRRFVNEYKTMRALQDAFINEDRETIAKFRAADPQRFNNLLKRYETPDRMIEGFQQYWGDYFGRQPSREFVIGGGFAPTMRTGPSSKEEQESLMSSSWNELITPVGAEPQKPSILDRLGNALTRTFSPFGTDSNTERRDRIRNYYDYQRQREENPWINFTFGR